MTPGFHALLRTLVEHEVEFLIVGGVAGVLHGAPIVTFDLDVLHRRTPGNVDRLLTALVSLDATYRTDARRLRPTTAHLMGPGHQLLRTTLGPIDVLGSIGEGLSYDDLVGTSVAVDLDGLLVRLLDLRTLIRLKEQLGREKDRAALDVLRHTLEESGQ
jgi:predicted nucleotidyltransferase